MTFELGDRFETHGEAKAKLFDYIEVFYNQERRHSTLGYLSPGDYERAARMRQVAYDPQVFIGHFAVAFASKAAAPRVSLAPLLVAPLALDMLWPIFLVLGIETVRIVPGDTAVTPLDLHDYPWSHSLVMSLVWAALAALLGWMALRQILAALVLGAGVFSHFILDFISHRPDLPLWPGSATYLGLGLWNSKLATALVEVPLFAIGVWLYCRSTRPTSKAGTINLVAMVALLGLLYVGNLTGPPPPSVKALIIAAFASWIFIPWAWFIDRRRGPPIRA